MRKFNLAREELKDLYWDKGLSTCQIAEQFNVDSITVSRNMKRLEIPIRTLGEAESLAIRKGRKRMVCGMGEASTNWKGGRKLTGDGYIQVYKPKYPRANKAHYVLEHIFVWEQYHKKSLPQGWVIHHLNGIRNDNRPCNLVALPNNKHRYLIATFKKKIRETEIENCQLRRALENSQANFYISEN